MGLFKQLMIFGKTGLQGLPTRVTLFLWAFSRQGATGSPYSQHGILWQVRGEPQYLETFRAGADPGDKSLTCEPILPSRTAKHLARYWFAVRTVKLVHRSEIYHKSSPPLIEPQNGELLDHQ
jgi:hypothetical protein